MQKVRSEEFIPINLTVFPVWVSSDIWNIISHNEALYNVRRRSIGIACLIIASSLIPDNISDVKILNNLVFFRLMLQKPKSLKQIRNVRVKKQKPLEMMVL